MISFNSNFIDIFSIFWNNSNNEIYLNRVNKQFLEFILSFVLNFHYILKVTQLFTEFWRISILIGTVWFLPVVHRKFWSKWALHNFFSLKSIHMGRRQIWREYKDDLLPILNLSSLFLNSKIPGPSRDWAGFLSWNVARCCPAVLLKSSNTFFSKIVTLILKLWTKRI